MSEIIETSFQAYKLSEEELTAARHLNPEQRMYYQSLLASAAEEKLAEEYPAIEAERLRFAQREAYLRGQMDILNMLLADSGSISRPKRYEEVPNPTPVTPS